MQTNTEGQRLRALRKRRGWSQEELARRTGVARSTISEIESGRRDARGGTLGPIAHALGISVDQLLADPDGPSAQPERASDRGPAPPYFAVVQRRGNVEPTAWLVKSVPVTRQRLHAGWMEPADAEPPLLIAVPKDSTYLAMRVAGECMEPECSPGDFAILDCDASPQLGEAVVVEVDGEQSLRYLAEETPTHLTLRAENDAFPDMIVAREAARVLGVIVAYQRQPKRLRPSRRERTG
jgi:transcriptional regulator with XRE-family HTH domain